MSTAASMNWAWSSTSDASSPVRNEPTSPPDLSPQMVESPSQRSYADNIPTSGNSWWDMPPPGLERSHGSSSPGSMSNPNDVITANFVAAIENLAIDDTLDPELTYVTEWEQAQVERESVWAETVASDSKKVEVVDSLWDDDEMAAKVLAPQALCIAHGIICKKGICQEFSHQLKAAKREEERKRKEKMREERQNLKKRKKARKDGEGETSDGEWFGQF
jgi:hypothetical protein